MSLVSGRNTRNWPNLIFSIIHPQEINTQVYQWTKPPGDEGVINWKAFFPLSNTFELSRLFQDCIDNFQSNFFPDWTTIASSFCFQDLSKLSVNCLSSADEQWGCAYAYEEDKDYAHDDEDYASDKDVNDDDLINDEEDDDGSRTIVHHRPSLIWMISGSSQAGQRDNVRYCSTNNEYKRTKRTLKTHEIIESSMHKSNKLRHWQDILWRECSRVSDWLVKGRQCPDAASPPSPIPPI